MTDSLKLFKPIVRNLPTTHMHRIHAWAVCSTAYDKNRRLDSCYLIGESCAGLGVIGRNHLVHRDKGMTHRFPMMEIWKNDYAVPASVLTEDSVFTPHGFDGSMVPVVKWIGGMFEKYIVRDICAGLAASDAPHDVTKNLHMLGCDGIRSDKMTEWLVSRAAMHAAGNIKFETTGGAVEPREKSFLIQQMLWHVYGRPLLAYIPKTKSEREEESGYMDKSIAFLNMMHDLMVIQKQKKGDTE